MKNATKLLSLVAAAFWAFTNVGLAQAPNPCFSITEACRLSNCVADRIAYHSITYDKFTRMREDYYDDGKEMSHTTLSGILLNKYCNTHYLIINGDHQDPRHNDIEPTVLQLTATSRQSILKDGTVIYNGKRTPVQHSITLLKGLLSTRPHSAVYTFYKARKINNNEDDIIFSVRFSNAYGNTITEYYDLSQAPPSGR